MTDTQTGLPELPEGHFWRIGKDFVSIRKTLPDTEWQDSTWSLTPFDELRYGLEGESETKTVEEPHTVKGRYFWQPDRQETRKVYLKRRVKRSQEIVIVYTEFSGETKVVPSTVNYGGGLDYRRYVSGYGDFAFPRYERTEEKIIRLRKQLTRDGVLGLCAKALVELDGLSLQGDYPPKVFNAAAGE